MRSGAVAPALQAAVWACMLMSVMLVVEATYNCAVSIGVKLLGWKPEHRFKWEPLAGDGDEEKGDAAAAYPMVMVQIPMYNELEVNSAHLIFTEEFEKIRILRGGGGVFIFVFDSWS